jgi:hypothetical protein
MIRVILACTVLGSGVALIIAVGKGADGYTTLIAGVAHVTGAPFVVVTPGQMSAASNTHPTVFDRPRPGGRFSGEVSVE